MKLLRAPLLLCAAAAVLPACGGHGGQHPALPATSPPALVLTSDSPSVPAGASPPVSLVWNVGFTENVPMSAMEAQLPKFIQLSQDLWTITEGQVWISRIRFSDNAAPGAEASSSQALRVPNLDVVIYPAARWNVAPVTGETVFFSPTGTLGRTNRRIDVPDNAQRLTVIHEASHFAWQLSWTGNNLPPGLDDEYVYSPDDPACVMDLMFLPLRWCSGGSLPAPNHVTKNGGQGAQSCWEQIRLDYPNFSYSGSNTSSSATPAMAVEYSDTP
jgi:hypothetical protein